MVAPHSTTTNEQEQDQIWAQEIKQFEETKAGVKGLVDSGVTKIPRIFVHPVETLHSHPCQKTDLPLELPTIDLRGFNTNPEKRTKIVEEIRRAAHEWGFFNVINHGVSLDLMDSMVEAVRRFHEMPAEEKKEFYSLDNRKRVKFNSVTGSLRQGQSASWRDLLSCVYQDDMLDPEEIPLPCRKEVQEYVKCMIELREAMAELLSEALGLNKGYLSSLECTKSEVLACLYYPACPEPEKTLGTPKHSDTTFLTLLMQDSVGGLQILHDGQWVDVPPVRGAIVANIGDLMQIISNDKFVSVEHRVLAQAVGPRVSVACFFTPSVRAIGKPFAPIKEILSEETPALYREFMFLEYTEHYKKKMGQLDDSSALPHFRIR